MDQNQRKVVTAVGSAVVAGVVAAGVVYLLHMRPQWKRHVVEIGRHLLGVADGLIHHHPHDEA